MSKALLERNIPAGDRQPHAQDARDSMFTETEMGQALREIRARDPIFDMVGFLRMLRRGAGARCCISQTLLNSSTHSTL